MCFGQFDADSGLAVTHNLESRFERRSDAKGRFEADKRVGQLFFLFEETVQGAWTGTIDATGTTLSGTWTQGTSAPLTFKRDTFVTAATPSAIDGYWLGTLKAGSQSLRIQVSLQSDASGHERCTLDSLDQGAFGLACENVSFRGQDLAFDIPAVKGHWGGKLSADGASLRGTWSQGQPLPLDFARQARSQAPPPPPPVTYDPAIAPVDAVKPAEDDRGCDQ